MKPTKFLVQANSHEQQLITCGIEDQLLKKFPISVVFFYQKSVPHHTLVEALKEILSDFPLFAGTLKNINGNLCIDCNNQGILFSVNKDNDTLAQILQQLRNIQQKKLINSINPQQVISNQSPIMTIQLTYFACGGMALGVSWHHSIGDMHSFICFMKAWSNKVNQEKYVLPLIIQQRDKYLQENLQKNENLSSGVRYLKLKEFLQLIFYLLLPVKNKRVLQIYFSEDELKNMKQDFLVKTAQNLSTNDVFCAYLLGILSELDPSSEIKSLSIAVNYRSRMKLPENILGNFISFMTLINNQKFEPLQLAQNLRASIDNFPQLHMNFFSTQKYIEQNGGQKKIDRFLYTGIDPMKNQLLITNWSKFGVYDINFLDSKPIYFTPFSDSPFPWLSVIVEGFFNQGLIYSVALPNKLANILMHKDTIRKIHQYRDRQEIIPEFIQKLEWLL